MDVAVFDGAMIALQHDRPRRAFVAVEGTAGDAGDGLFVDHGRAVHNHRNESPHERDGHQYSHHENPCRQHPRKTARTIADRRCRPRPRTQPPVAL